MPQIIMLVRWTYYNLCQRKLGSGRACLRTGIRFPLNPLESCPLLPFPSPPSLLPLAPLGFLDTFPCKIPPGPECIFFRIGIRLPLNPFESYLFLPFPPSPPSLPSGAISLAPLSFSALRTLSPHDDVDVSLGELGITDGVAVSDSC